MIPAKLRGYLYVFNIVLAVVSLVLAIGIVLFGWVTEEQVAAILLLAVSIYNGIVGAIARANLTPDPE